MTDATLATAAVAASDTIRTIGILHFTIGVRDHIAAAEFYSQVLGCKHMRSNERYSFMECGGSYFVLAKMPNHVNPNVPGDDAHHHAIRIEHEGELILADKAEPERRLKELACFPRVSGGNERDDIH